MEQKNYLKGKENIPIITHMLFKWLISYLACLYADTAKCSFYFYGRCASDYLYRKKYADLSCNASYIWNTSRIVSIALLHWIRRKRQFFLTIWRKIILLIPLIFILPRILSGSAMEVFLAEPIADTIAICTTAPMFYYYYRKLK